MTMTGLEIEETARDGVSILSVAGELDLATAPDLCTCLKAHRRERFVVDVSRILFCDSCGLRALLGEARECRVAGGHSIVVIPSEGQVRQLFDMTGLSSIDGVTDDFAAAVEHLQRR